MEVNMTLVLQAMQFGCSYFFLYRFLFAPAYVILVEQEQYEKSLHTALQEEQNIKNVLLDTYKIKTHYFKQTLIQSIPEQVGQDMSHKSSLSSVLYSVESVHLSEQEKENTELFLIDHLSKVVKK